MDPAMRIFKRTDQPVNPADSATFTPPATTQRLAQDEAGVPVHVYRVAFGEGGRTFWHSHSGPQWLFVVEGRIRVQTWGQPPCDVEAGDAVVIPPGEKHWHGAAPGGPGVHLAVNVNATTRWMERVEEN
jgi:quercetin dioxygenase-like cupin family protein